MNKKFLILSLIFIFVLTACGAGGNGASKTINVELSDFHYTPDAFTVPAGEDVTLIARNTGAVIHEFVIMKFGTTVGEDFGDEDTGNIYWELEVEPGESKTVTFTTPKDLGEYQVVCGTQGHFVAGMVGKLTVVAAQ